MNEIIGKSLGMLLALVVSFAVLTMGSVFHQPLAAIPVPQAEEIDFSRTMYEVAQLERETQALQIWANDKRLIESRVCRSHLPPVETYIENLNSVCTQVTVSALP